MMKADSWQATILAHFTPKREQLLVVIDPDNLLQDDALLAEIQNSNYDVLELEDEVSFRNRFERNYRTRWDAGEPRHVVIVVHTTDGDRHIPYDLWQKGRRIELSVSALFPNLNAIVVRQLDHACYGDLYPAHQALLAHNEKLLLERQTIEFILRTVFDLDPAGAKDPARWVEFLIHRHYSARSLPSALEAYVAEKLLPEVSDTGLQVNFLQDARAFYAWLSQAWVAYVTTGTENAYLAEPRLRPLLSALFAEGLLQRAPARADLPAKDAWIAAGLVYPAGSGKTEIARERSDQDIYNLTARLTRFQSFTSEDLPAGGTDLRDWLNLAAEWAEVVYQVNSLSAGNYTQVSAELFAARKVLDAAFWSFVQARYSAVSHYQDNKGPICLTGVNRWLNHQVSPDERLALLCLDGLSLDQWYLLRDFLNGVLPGLSFNENRTYAVAPTLTPVSRQALFSGRQPTEFADTLWKTDQDEKRWRSYWVNQNIPPARVAYTTVRINGQGLEKLRAITDSNNRRLGVLVNFFDDVLHGVEGMPAGADKRVLYDTLRSHLENGHLADLFGLLLEAGYRLYLTADHGNIAGVGNGLTPPRTLSETYARRVVVFDREPLAEEYARQRGLMHYRTKALPPDVHPVYLPGNQLFALQGEARISHGGLSLEELIVPFIEVRLS
ncbi:MAG: BREX-3 system phosphatase PglZ [Chloroflexota bacterium]